MPEDHFGGRLAARYDESSAEMFAPGVVEPAVHFLAQLAGDGAALELGIGTGRIALPLAQRGVRVHGIDLSEAMVARLPAKPGADKVGVTTSRPRISASTSTTSSRRVSSRITTRLPANRWTSSRYRSATSGRRSST